MADMAPTRLKVVPEMTTSPAILEMTAFLAVRVTTNSLMIKAPTPWMVVMVMTTFVLNH